MLEFIVEGRLELSDLIGVGKAGSSVPFGVSFAMLGEESVGRAASFGGVNASGGGANVSVEGTDIVEGAALSPDLFQKLLELVARGLLVDKL